MMVKPIPIKGALILAVPSDPRKCTKKLATELPRRVSNVENSHRVVKFRLFRFFPCQRGALRERGFFIEMGETILLHIG